MMNLAYIGQRGVPPTFGGVERYVDEIVRRVPRDYAQTWTYCRRHYVAEDSRVEYTNQVFAPSMQAKGLEAFSHSFFSAVDALRHRFDLVHFQALGPALFSGIPKLVGSKIVVTVHGLDWQREKWGFAGRTVIKSGDWMMGHAADAIISVSRNLRRYYEDKYHKDCFFVPIGFSAPKLLPVNLINRNFGLEPQKFILFLNRLVPEKGAHYLIQAFRRLKTDHKLVIAGHDDSGGTYTARLKELAAGDERIVFTGYVSREEVHELYSNAFLFSLPSDLEGMPAVILEALSHQCPVLTSDIQESLDVIDHGSDRFGFVHRAGDVDHLTDQLRHLVDNPCQVEKLRKPGCEFVHANYSWDRAVEMTVDVYRHVLGA